jgi:AcrR family transcriptional regulator
MAARRAIIRKGIEATMRDIASEGGFTTGLVSHYFPDRRSVIVGAFAGASDEFVRTVRETFASAPDTRALLVSFMEVALSDRPERQAEWRLWAEMWAYAGRDREFANLVERTDTLWARELEHMVSRLVSDGMLRPDLDAAAQATILARLVDGLGLRAWLTGNWDGARGALASHLESLGLPARLASRLSARNPKRARGS